MDINAAIILVIERALRGGGLGLVAAAMMLALGAVVIVALALWAFSGPPEPVLLAPLRWEACRGGACAA